MIVFYILLPIASISTAVTIGNIFFEPQKDHSTEAMIFLSIFNILLFYTISTYSLLWAVILLILNAAIIGFFLYVKPANQKTIQGTIKYVGLDSYRLAGKPNKSFYTLKLQTESGDFTFLLRYSLYCKLKDANKTQISAVVPVDYDEKNGPIPWVYDVTVVETK